MGKVANRVVLKMGAVQCECLFLSVQIPILVCNRCFDSRFGETYKGTDGSGERDMLNTCVSGLTNNIDCSTDGALQGCSNEYHCMCKRTGTMC